MTLVQMDVYLEIANSTTHQIKWIQNYVARGTITVCSILTHPNPTAEPLLGGLYLRGSRDDSEW